MESLIIRLPLQISTTDQPHPPPDCKKMFSLQPSDELVFGTTPCEEDQILMDDAALTQTNFINFSTGSSSSNRRVNSGGLTRQTDHVEGESDVRRVLHRDIERKRRQQMSDLHLTLASLLPPTQHNKEKSGVCDQMQEAASYIKNMHNKIQQLKIQRDGLITKVSENKVVISSSGSDGMEILIKTRVYFEVSAALEVLAKREIDVDNYVSTQTNGGFLHKIHIQARDMKSLDVSVLEDELSN